MPPRRGKLPPGWVPKSPAAKPAGTPARPGDVTPRTDADGNPVMANGEPNPTGTGRYCAPLRCYCGGCPSWRPRPPVDYAATLARLAKAAAYLPPELPHQEDE